MPAAHLFVSNAPERVPCARVLLEGRLEHGAPAQLLYHHVNDTPGVLAFAVELLNPGPTPLQVRVIAAPEGPSFDEIHVGHTAMLAFAKREAAGTGYVHTVPAQSALAPIKTAFPPRSIVSGLARFTVLTPGGSLILRVRTLLPQERYTVSPLSAYVPSAVFGDYAYAVPSLSYQGTYIVGGSWLFVPLGLVDFPAHRPGQELAGSYGVRHSYQLTAVNVEEHPVTIEIVVNAVGGVGRLVYALNDTWRETGLLRPEHETRLTTVTLPARSSRTIHLTALPESGSNYPMMFIMRMQR